MPSSKHCISPHTKSQIHIHRQTHKHTDTQHIHVFYQASTHNKNYQQEAKLIEHLLHTTVVLSFYKISAHNLKTTQFSEQLR